ncbi:MAG: histidinol-phosphatase [bacterium]
MAKYIADFHTHTTLSPCGDIEMTSMFIINRARELGVDIVGITDHNSTRQAREIKRALNGDLPYILCGAEITSREEVHCLAFVDGEERLQLLQNYIDDNLPNIENNVDIFGYQLVVNLDEEVLYEEPKMLISSINQSVEQIEKFVHSIDGIFIPAHIDKTQNSIISQLGFVPFDLNCDALEVSHRCKLNEFLDRNSYLKKSGFNFIMSSDAHYPEEFCRATTSLELKNLDFIEIKKALNGVDGCCINIG